MRDDYGDRQEPESGHYVAQGLRLHYVDWGNPGGRPLLLIHGGSDHCRSWDWVASRLRARFHVMAPDLRGHGDSQWSPGGAYSLAAHVYDLARMIDLLALDRPIVVAHSLGAQIALRHAGLYPASVAAIVAIEGLGRSPEAQAAREARPIDCRMREWIDRQRSLDDRLPRRYASISDAALRMRHKNPRLTEDQASYIARHGLKRNDDGTFGWKFDPLGRVPSPVDMAAAEQSLLWSKISCPVLLVQGGASDASDPAQDGRLAPFANATVSVFEDAGHWVHHERLDDFVATLTAFLEG